MTTRYNASNAKRLHELGVQFCLMHLSCKRHGHRIYMPDGTEIQVHTQNTMGEAFTLWVNGREDFAKRLIGTSHVLDRKSTRLNSSHVKRSRMPSSA